MELRVGFRGSPADRRAQAGQNLQVVGRAAIFGHAALHVDVIGARRFQRVGQAIDHIGGGRRQFAPVLGRAGLHDHRVALRGGATFSGPRTAK